MKWSSLVTILFPVGFWMVNYLVFNHSKNRTFRFDFQMVRPRPLNIHIVVENFLEHIKMVPTIWKPDTNCIRIITIPIRDNSCFWMVTVRIKIMIRCLMHIGHLHFSCKFWKLHTILWYKTSVFTFECQAWKKLPPNLVWEKKEFGVRLVPE
jgi:hypothetical protein